MLMKAIKYDKREWISNDCKVVRYGKYTESNDGIHVISSIDEFTFYKIYLELNNVIRWKRVNGGIVDTKISDTPVELMAHIMTKPVDFSLIYRNKDSKLIDIAKELDKSANSVYASMNRLRQAEYLIKNEDSLFVPNQELRDLMNKVKSSVVDGAPLTFDYLFKFCVK